MGIGYMQITMPFYMMDLVSSGGLEINPLWIPSDDYIVLKKKKFLNLLDLLFATSDKYIGSEKYPSTIRKNRNESIMAK